jgi:low temperature requirement protein LtrA
MVAGIIVPVVADELTIARRRRRRTAAVIFGGPALHLAGDALFKWTVFAPWSWSRAVAIAVLAVTHHVVAQAMGSAA